MNTDKLLRMLLEAIDYSFLQTDGSYDKTLTYPVIDKIQYIKEQIKDVETKEVNLEEEITSQIRMLNGVHTLDNGKQWWKGTYNELSYFAKYFFELGLKIKGE